MGGRGKGRKRTASLISMTACKKASVDDSIVNNTQTGDLEDSDSEFVNMSASLPAGSVDHSFCKKRIDTLRLESNELLNCIKKQSEQLQVLSTQVSFLLSALGLSEDEVSAIGRPYSMLEQDNVSGDPNNSVKPTANEIHATDQPSVFPFDVGSSNRIRGPGMISYADAVKKIQTSVIAAVHVEQKLIKRRSRNFVISGLTPAADITDKMLVERFVAD